jgi:signal transduction histidine kinase
MRLLAPITRRWKSQSLALQIATVTLALVVAWLSAIEWTSRELVGSIHRAAADAQTLRAAEHALSGLEAELVRTQRPVDAAERDSLVRGVRATLVALQPLVARYPGPATARDAFSRAFDRWVETPTRSRENSVREAHETFAAVVRGEADAAVDTEASAVAAARLGARRLRFALLSLLVLLVAGAHRALTRTLRSFVRGANGLADGDYESVELLAALQGFREGTELAVALDRLGLAVAQREQIARSEILQLREIEQMKTHFVSTVSHELRTPLTSIRGSLGLVLATANGELGEKAIRLLRIASQNTDRLIRLINDILDVEKIEAGHVALKKEDVDLRVVLRTAVMGMEGFATDAGIALVLAGGEPVRATVDPDRLVQVVTNLVSNAIKFSPPGEPVEIGIEAREHEVRITVRDHGPGIPAEFRNKIFGKFQQADVSDAKAKGGTGLGLAIARAIVLLHDGEIDFESEPRRGTTFVVTLPWSPAPSISRRTPIGGIALLPAADAPDGAAGAPYRPTILIAERDAGVRELLTTLCAPFGEVVCAASGAEAIAVSAATTFDAVIVDPELDEAGPAFAQRLRRRINGDATPVIVFSGREYTATELEGLLLSHSHAFVKSRDSERDLVMRLRAVLAARRAS